MGLSQKSIEALLQQYIKYDDAYRIGRPLVSDQEFDALKKVLLEEAPDHPVLENAGEGIVLKSMGNQPFNNWFADSRFSTVIVQPKIDGIAIALRYKQGHLVKAWNRKGNDKTQALRLVKNIPTDLRYSMNGTVDIRGELFVRGVDRNVSQQTAAGHIRKKKPLEENDLCFSAFEIMNQNNIPFYSTAHYPTEKHILDQLTLWGFDTPPTYIAETWDVCHGFHQKWLDGLFHNSEYPSDGVAFKVMDREVQKEMGCSSVAPRWQLAVKEDWKH